MLFLRRYLIKTNKYVAYYRVSTREQGISGLGLDDQKFTVKNHVQKENIVKEFQEIESGRKKERPKLETAIEYCKENNCTLIVSKLDRLGRIAKHLLDIRDSVDLYVCEKPNMDTIEFGIRAILAQNEAERISERTKAALAAKKRQGFKLGNPENLTKKAMEQSLKVRRSKAKAHGEKVVGTISKLRESGHTYREIATCLNEIGSLSPRGKKFKAMTVKRIFDKFASSGA